MECASPKRLRRACARASRLSVSSWRHSWAPLFSRWLGCARLQRLHLTHDRESAALVARRTQSDSLSLERSYTRGHVIAVECSRRRRRRRRWGRRRSRRCRWRIVSAQQLHWRESGRSSLGRRTRHSGSCGCSGWQWQRRRPGWLMCGCAGLWRRRMAWTRPRRLGLLLRHRDDHLVVLFAKRELGSWLA